jgi:hypothetical protein
LTIHWNTSHCLSFKAAPALERLLTVSHTAQTRERHVDPLAVLGLFEELDSSNDDDQGDDRQDWLITCPWLVLVLSFNYSGIRKGKLENCSGVRLRTLFVYRFSASLIKIITVNTIKPVLYSIVVKKGSKKTQKAAL